MEDRPLMNGTLSNGGGGGGGGGSGSVHTATKTATSRTSPPFHCSGCGKPIVDQFLLKALDVYWHEDCLKCGCCDCRLGEVGSTLYTRANLILCKRDYLRLFGTSGNCAACCKVIPAFEMVMRAKSNVYHLECFACQQCHQRFCVGDRFYLVENRILCEYDYEERMIFANINSNSAASLANIQRRVTDIQPGNGAIGQTRDAHSRGFGQSLMEAASHYPAMSSHYPNNPPSQAGAFHADGEHVQQRRGGPLPPHFSNHQQQQQQQQQQQRLVSNATAKHGSPSDGSSSGYGSPDSVLLEER